MIEGFCSTDIYEEIFTSEVEESKDDDAFVYSYTTFIVGVFTVIFFATVGLFANGVTIHVTRKKKNKVGTIYIMALAIVDVTTLCTILPMMPFIEILQKEYEGVFYTSYYVTVAIAMTYLWILLAMTLERLVAVFRPFQLKQLRLPIQRAVLVLGTVHFTITAIRCILHVFGISSETQLYIYSKIGSSITFLLISAILIAYPAIIVKLASHGHAITKSKDNGKRQQKSTNTPKDNVAISTQNDFQAESRFEHVHCTGRILL